MTYYGVYRGNVIETPHHFSENQKVIIIPVKDSKPKNSQEKKQIMILLFQETAKILNHR